MLKCQKTVEQHSALGSNIFTEGRLYDFVHVENRFTRMNNFIGYIKKDDEGYKRWLTNKFKALHFTNNTSDEVADGD